MSQIYNGSFTLGNTSACTISAGPGIKIDDSSVPGVIKVSTDETVLWSGSYTPVNNGYIDLSGSLSSYDKVSFVINGFSTFMPQNYEYTFWSGSDKTIPIVAFGVPGEGGVRLNSCKATCNNEYNRLTFSVCKQQNIFGTSISTASFNSVISKIIGINRISGGN